MGTPLGSPAEATTCQQAGLYGLPCGGARGGLAGESSNQGSIEAAWAGGNEERLITPNHTCRLQFVKWCPRPGKGGARL